MSCHATECLCKNDCEVIGCILQNPLLHENLEELIDTLKRVNECQRLKYVNRLMEKLSPPKVNQGQIDRWFVHLRRTGIDMDKVKMTKKEMRRQKHTVFIDRRRPIYVEPKKVDFSDIQNFLQPRGTKM